VRRALRRALRRIRARAHGHGDHDHGGGRWGAIPELPTLSIFPPGHPGNDGCPPLLEPDWRAATSADYMRDDDPVLGFCLDGKAWALPWWVMKNHHVANLTLDGTPRLVAFCEACSSAALFDPVIDGTRHSFRVAGHYNGSHILRDEQTGSIWGPFTGEALNGTRKGFVLERLPLYQCRWEEWRTLHPATLVAHEPPEAREGHGAKHSPGNFHMSRSFRRSLARPLDERLAPSALVLGVKVDGVARAYPLERLDTAGPVVNDSLAGRPIAVIHPPGTLMAAAFDRTVGDQALVFEAGPTGAVVDREHRTRWSHTGEALDGPLAGHKLPFVRSGIEEWYIWAAYHPATTIFDGDAAKA
jgi:hypothetical protein